MFTNILYVSLITLRSHFRWRLSQWPRLSTVPTTVSVPELTPSILVTTQPTVLPTTLHRPTTPDADTTSPLSSVISTLMTNPTSTSNTAVTPAKTKLAHNITHLYTSVMSTAQPCIKATPDDDATVADIRDVTSAVGGELGSLTDLNNTGTFKGTGIVLGVLSGAILLILVTTTIVWRGLKRMRRPKCEEESELAAYFHSANPHSIDTI